jgi:hypothetical protein
MCVRTLCCRSFLRVICVGLCVLSCSVPSWGCRPRGSDCGIVNVNVGTSGAEIGGAFGACALLAVRLCCFAAASPSPFVPSHALPVCERVRGGPSLLHPAGRSAFVCASPTFAACVCVCAYRRREGHRRRPGVRQRFLEAVHAAQHVVRACPGREEGRRREGGREEGNCVLCYAAAAAGVRCGGGVPLFAPAPAYRRPQRLALYVSVRRAGTGSSFLPPMQAPSGVTCARVAVYPCAAVLPSTQHRELLHVAAPGSGHHLRRARALSVAVVGWEGRGGNPLKMPCLRQGEPPPRPQGRARGSV